jgi:hypothetical protein
MERLMITRTADRKGRQALVDVDNYLVATLRGISNLFGIDLCALCKPLL